MYFDKYNYQDCNKYFADTYVQFAEEGMNKLFWLEKCDQNYIKAVEVKRDSRTGKVIKGEHIVVALDKGYAIDFTLPRKAVFQNNDCAYLLSRIPAKQWKKGIHPQNTRIYTLRLGKWEEYGFLLDIILNYINKPVFKTFDELVLAKKEESMVSIALSSRCAVDMETGNVYLDRFLVGNFSFKTNKLSCHSFILSELVNLFPYSILETYQ